MRLSYVTNRVRRPPRKIAKSSDLRLTKFWVLTALDPPTNSAGCPPSDWSLAAFVWAQGRVEGRESFGGVGFGGTEFRTCGGEAGSGRGFISIRFRIQPRSEAEESNNRIESNRSIGVAGSTQVLVQPCRRRALALRRRRRQVPLPVLRPAVGLDLGGSSRQILQLPLPLAPASSGPDRWSTSSSGGSRSRSTPTTRPWRPS